MIQCFLIINNHGKPRLTKFYEQLAVDKQQELLRTVFNVVTRRGAPEPSSAAPRLDDARRATSGQPLQLRGGRGHVRQGAWSAQAPRRSR